MSGTCDTFCKCLTCPIGDDVAVEISEFLFIFAGCLFIEWGFEFYWKDGNWIQESAISSGVAVIYSLFVSTALRVLHFQLQKTEQKETEIIPARYFYIATAVSQIPSTIISFFVGLLFDVLFHHTLKEWEGSEKIVTAIVAPVGLVLAKSVFRYGIFKLCSKMISNCYPDDDRKILNNASDEGTRIYSK